MFRRPLANTTTAPILNTPRKWEAFTRPFAIVKPQRQLGAVWIDSYVAHRKNVNLCEVCWRRYEGWWKRYEYRPDWDERWITDCDGCSERAIICYGFYPAEMFYRVLSPRHGKSPAPNKR